MELIYFSEQTLPKTTAGGNRSARPRITFNKTGLIFINTPAGELMGLKADNKISLAQDKKEPQNWYLFIDANGFAVRAGSKKKGFVFNHRDLVRSFVGAFDKDISKSHSFLIGGQPTTMKGSKTQYWGILVK